MNPLKLQCRALPGEPGAVEVDHGLLCQALEAGMGGAERHVVGAVHGQLERNIQLAKP